MLAFLVTTKFVHSKLMKDLLPDTTRCLVELQIRMAQILLGED